MERKGLSWVVCQSSTLDRGGWGGEGVRGEVYDLGKEKRICLEGECRSVFKVRVETQETLREQLGCWGAVVKAVSGVRGARTALQGVLLCAGWAEEPAEQAVLGILPLAQPDPPSLLEVHILELLTLSLCSESPSPSPGSFRSCQLWSSTSL